MVYLLKYAQGLVFLLFIVVILSSIVWFIYSYSSWLFHWHWHNRMIVPMPLRQSCRTTPVDHSCRIWVKSTGTKLQQIISDVIMGTMASQITSLTIVYSIIYSGADQRKHQSSASLAFVWGIYRWPVNSPHKCPVTRKMFPFDDVIMATKSPKRE